MRYERLLEPLTFDVADERGLIGLAFEPTRDRDRPDVSGVLWLDEETAELRFAEYRYTDPPWDIEFSEAGGRIEFEQLATGGWIVRRWWIRMPVLGVRNRTFSDFVRENYLVALKEDGGYVREVSTLNGEPVACRGVATLAGRVVNLRTGEPVPAAQIKLVGTDYSAQTNNQGQFRFGFLPEGTYRVSYGSATLDMLGYVPPLIVRIDFALPSVERRPGT